MFLIIVNRHTPLLVMIRDEMRLATNPSAADLAIGDWLELFGHRQRIRLKNGAAFYI
jgi:hypothetical protein